MTKALSSKLQGFFKTQPVEKAWVFGSFSRGEERPDSDVDIMVSFTPDARMTLMKYSGMMCDLEDLTGRKVDLVQEGMLMPFAVESANRDRILVYDMYILNSATL